MPRFALILEYNGFGFVGWQSQASGKSLQQTVQCAVRRLEPDVPEVVAAGRTDSGVHAFGQVIHCDLRKDWDPERLCDALNAQLRPETISVLQAARVSQGFSARFSAVRRTYLYRIVVRRAPLAHEADLVWRVARRLDAAAMRSAAGHLVGRHDFTTFRSARCQAVSPVKTLDSLTVERTAVRYGYELRIRAEARSFLHRQMRSMVGTLERVGAGAITPGQLRDALESCDRSRCGPVAPARGLFLECVDYDPDPFCRP